MKLNEVTEVKASDLDKVKNYNSGNLNISCENLISLEGCPEEITGLFVCNQNKLTSLEGCPKEVTGDFGCNHNRLVSLKYCPKKINGDFGCRNNYLTSLKDGPTETLYQFICNDNQLSSFEYFPIHVGINCHISGNKFTSFKDIDKHIEFIGGNLYAYNMNITSGYSDLFGIDGLLDLQIDNRTIQNVVNRYLFDKDLIEFQDEMIKAGFESYL